MEWWPFDFAQGDKEWWNGAMVEYWNIGILEIKN
jgi:hypothetical protein